MSEGYIGLAPSCGVFQKQVIAGTTASNYESKVAFFRWKKYSCQKEMAKG